MIIRLNNKEFDSAHPESLFIHGDCMDYLPQIPDGFFDLAIVDPPYGINATKFGNGAGAKDHATGSTARRLRKGRLNQGAGKLKDRSLQNMMCDWDFEIPPPEYFQQLRRVSRNQIIWGGNYYDLPPTRGIICWDKEQPWENFSQVEMAWTSFDRPASLFRYCNAGGVTGEKKIHPTQKPVALYKWLVNKYAEPGDIILDTHVGSASSLVAYRETNHKYIGFEIDEEYYRTASERVNAAEAQMTLFDMKEEDVCKQLSFPFAPIAEQDTNG